MLVMLVRVVRLDRVVRLVRMVRLVRAVRVIVVVWLVWMVKHNFFSKIIKNSIEKRALRASALRADGVPLRVDF